MIPSIIIALTGIVAAVIALLNKNEQMKGWESALWAALAGLVSAGGITTAILLGTGHPLVALALFTLTCVIGVMTFMLTTLLNTTTNQKRETIRAILALGAFVGVLWSGPVARPAEAQRAQREEARRAELRKQLAPQAVLTEDLKVEFSNRAGKDGKLHTYMTVHRWDNATVQVLEAREVELGGLRWLEFKLEEPEKEEKK